MSVSEFVTMARLVGGKLKIRNVEHFNAGLAAMKDGEVVVSVACPKATRSDRLNRLYWAGYVQPFSEHTGYTPREVHEYFKQRFLSEVGSKRLIICDTIGDVKDEAEIHAVTTRTLTEEQFRAYLKDIEALAVDLNIAVGSRIHDEGLER